MGKINTSAPRATKRRFKTAAESFAYRTHPDGDCLIWDGSTDRHGYGQISNGRGGSTAAHRWAYENANGPIPEGMLVDHICHRPLCVNAEHLRLATQKQNGENRKGANKNNQSSGMLGVTFDKRTGRWAVKVTHNRGSYWGGRHDTKEQAAAAAHQLRASLFTHAHPYTDARNKPHPMRLARWATDLTGAPHGDQTQIR